MKTTVILLLLVFFIGCSRTPAPPPKEALTKNPWGALDLNISSKKTPFGLRASLGSSLLKKYQDANDTNITYNILAISGGGSHGAYGVGLLNGWHKKGNMPKFDVVTGISTGSIIASFIFIGGDKIEHIAKIYTSIKTSDIYHYNFFKVFGGASITSTQAFKEIIKKEITPQILDAVAKEYKNGRRLYVGTTNIDAGKFVVWDMGAIAASNHPNKLQLYRDVIYASCAIPGIFDPQYFKIKYQQKEYSQLHIDGGMYAHVFMIGLLENWREILNVQDAKKFNVNVYVIGNRKYRYLNSHEALSNDSAINILINVSKHSVDLLYDRSLYRLYRACETKGFNFYYKGIDDDIKLNSYPHQFIPEDMALLYKTAFDEAKTKIKWQRVIAEDEVLKH